MLNVGQICLLLTLGPIGAVSQLCLKRASRDCKGKRLPELAANLWLWLGIGFMGLNILVFAWILRKVPLTIAMPFAALTYILVPFGATRFFAERILPRFWLGAALICLGIVLTTL